MRLFLDTASRTLSYEKDDRRCEIGLYCREAFEILSDAWLAVGWNQKFTYTFSWQGRPIIQLPEDLIRIQEVIYYVKPDVIIETGVAHGGSLVYYASLCKIMDKGRVVGVDIDIRPHNRAAIENHVLSPWITLVQGSSTAADTLRQVEVLIKEGESALVLLDSCHSRGHVLEELRAYHPFVGVGSYLVATDGIMKDLYNVPRGDPSWKDDNPFEAARAFVAEHPEFALEDPVWPFNESELARPVTHWPSAWLRRLR
jgi:cephalosporin hydroxylase